MPKARLAKVSANSRPSPPKRDLLVAWRPPRCIQPYEGEIMAVRSERDKSSFDVSQFAPKNSDRQLRKMHLRCPPLKYLQSQRTHFEFAIHQCCSLLRYLRLSALRSPLRKVATKHFGKPSRPCGGRCRGGGRADPRRNLTQPAVSLQVRELAAPLGVQLMSPRAP